MMNIKKHEHSFGHMRYKLLSLYLLLFVPWTYAQEQRSMMWANDLNDDCFIENLGQFDTKLKGSEKILFGAEQQGMEIYFGLKGITYVCRVKNQVKWEEFIRLRLEEEEEKHALAFYSAQEKEAYALREAKKEDQLQNFNFYDTRTFHIQLKNAYSDVRLLPSVRLPQYYIYDLVKDAGTSLDHVPAYQKITYKDVYEHIDLEFAIHEKGGLKYSFVLHPGADPNDIEMEYDGLDEMHLDGDLLLKLGVVQLKDQGLHSFYASDQRAISSSFVLKDNTVSFEMGKYDISKKVIIDPWITAITNSTTNNGLKVKTDNAGNSFVYGRFGPGKYKVKMFNNLGVLQWTENGVPAGNTWSGALAVNKTNGDNYVTRGAKAYIKKRTITGALEWEVLHGPAGVSIFFFELFAMAFNCDYSKLTVVGSRNGGTNSLYIDPVIGDSTNNKQIYNTGPPTPNETRDMELGPDGNYYLLQRNTLSILCSKTGENLGLIPHTHGFSYYGPSYDSPSPAPSSNSGIAASLDFIYTSSGDSLFKWDILSQSLVTKIALPGGVFEGGSGVLVETT
ncbi:MAG TPA: hypothetical protein EYN71_06460 [Flavobacteriales bacterium]|nr:hypothetical protein [Flavobacteriales bacterium]